MLTNLFYTSKGISRVVVPVENKLDEKSKEDFEKQYSHSVTIQRVNIEKFLKLVRKEYFHKNDKIFGDATKLVEVRQEMKLLLK